MKLIEIFEYALNNVLGLKTNGIALDRHITYDDTHGNPNWLIESLFHSIVANIDKEFGEASKPQMFWNFTCKNTIMVEFTNFAYPEQKLQKLIQTSLNDVGSTLVVSTTGKV